MAITSRYPATRVLLSHVHTIEAHRHLGLAIPSTYCWIYNLT